MGGKVRQCLIPWGKEFGYYQQSTGKALGDFRISVSSREVMRAHFHVNKTLAAALWEVSS